MQIENLKSTLANMFENMVVSEVSQGNISKQFIIEVDPELGMAWSVLQGGLSNSTASTFEVALLVNGKVDNNNVLGYVEWHDVIKLVMVGGGLV